MTLDSMTQQNDIEFPVAAALEGGPTADREFVLLQLLTVEGGPIRFSLRRTDLESFITYLLRIAADLGGGIPSDERVQYQPIPISGVSVGELADGMGCLGVTVGETELMFQMPAAALSQVAQTLLTASAPDDRRRMS
jgi:hypothetical protein